MAAGSRLCGPPTPGEPHTFPSDLRTYFPAGSSNQLQPTMSVSTMNLEGVRISGRKLAGAVGGSGGGGWREAGSVPDLKVDIGLIRREAGGAQACHTDALLQEAAGRGHEAWQRQGDA